MATSPSRRKVRRRSPWVRRLKLALTLFCLLFSAAVIGLFGLFMVKYREAEEAMGTLADRMADVSRPPSRVLSADGKLLFQVSEVNRIPLKLSQIPKHVRQAILAAEDKRFYDHSGVDATGLLRAFLTIFKEGRVAQGGSTITMQLAKRLYSDNERSFMRKVQDIAFATAIEREIVNKDRILELYLNQVYFGEGAHGIGAAAKVYFNKPVEKLTLSEAAILARCVRLPSRENPITDLKLAMRNRDIVLQIMNEEHMITTAEYESALNETPKINQRPPKTTAFYPAGYGKHFVQHVMQFLDDENLGIDLKRGGFTVYTTLDSRLQRLAEQTVRQVVRENRAQRVTEGAFVAVDKDGRVLCEVGGIDFDRNEFNIITQGKLQPGSAFKAVVYATALRDGVLTSADDMLSNARIHEYDKGSRTMWEPKNSSKWETAGAYSLRTSFASSINLPAIHTSQKVGFDRIAQAATDVFGFRSKIRAVNSMALGVSEVTPLEMAEAYSVFMLQGDRVRPTPVVRIVDQSGEIVKSFSPIRYTAVLPPNVCTVMDDILHATVTSGTAQRTLSADFPEARGKTGTTNSAKDAWFCGYVDGVLGIGWVGNQVLEKGEWRHESMASSVYGGTVTTLIWKGVMKSARERFGVRIAPASESIVAEPDTSRVAKEPTKPTEPPVIPEIPIDTPPATGPDETKPSEETGTGDATAPTAAPETGAKPSSNPKSPSTDPFPDQVPPLDEPPKPDRKNRRRPSSNDDAETMVTVEVCVDSGRRATIYCPETVARSFPRNAVPRGRCRIHGTED